MQLTSTTLLALAIPPIFLAAMPFFGKSKLNPKGKHCYVTGGSTGLGLYLAILLVKKGAHVSIVARNEERLQKALEELEKARQTPDQVLRTYSYDLFDPAASAAAFDAACKEHDGKTPYAVFLCAGAARPGFFIEQDAASLQKGMDNGYWVQAYSALHATKKMVQQRSPGKIVFVSSLVGYMSIIGYSSYTPAKHALRGLAETLRSELSLYDISVHIFFPGTIYSPGLEEENKTKPKITLKIEEDDGGAKPEQVAAALYNGVEKGHFHITVDLIGELFRSSTRGSTPHNNVFLDIFYGLIGWIALAIWRRGVDGMVAKHRKEHEAYLVERNIRPEST
ncbi:oxidoreductase [Pluteus cervinus]|uniref:Oxidoreductase n=1 Tax=Pluteus cervinus TaxID=181527 RepID=A0ACD3BCV5_9AGAR|nr:oxidoreductase [Pluteus cervinus]